MTVLAPARSFLSLVKVEHSVFALPFAYLAALTAMAQRDRHVHFATLGLVTVAMVGARTFAMAANRIIDRRIDAGNPRTAGRELVTEENGEQQARADEVGPWVGRDPRLEGLAPLFGDRVRHAVAKARLADLDIAPLGEHAQLPVDLAAGDVPEVADGQLDQQPARPRPQPAAYKFSTGS